MSGDVSSLVGLDRLEVLRLGGRVRVEGDLAFLAGLCGLEVPLPNREVRPHANTGPTTGARLDLGGCEAWAS